ncbi:hypothetical protein GQ43DRAFT_386126 [Delitschia confertaspora ATCC 74209]|uniref:Pinin/SDK/MemA protein domain-containing protein n=1 Tax=Delitschia confertaspora ATCC 74209 TaxID=1513339 RepID=A0A9P4MZF0_9PLEO|nr:hypothetical protein GQ43DRAFT_386126 [Delitschia confertaspora ATCC 74209]
MNSSIASAVILPDASEDGLEYLPAPTSPRTGHKRGQSEISEDQHEKRMCLTHNGYADLRRGSEAENVTPQAASDRRKSSGVVNAGERSRTQRLFGGFLRGAVTQSSSTSAQKRRAEIEKKQQAKLKQREEEDLQQKQERIARLKVQREKEQREYDEESMQIRHTNMLAMAHSLRTQSEPRIYYKPWELTAEQEEQIVEQVAETQDIIDREVEEFNKHGEGDRHGDVVPKAEGGQAEGKKNDMDIHPQHPAENGIINDRVKRPVLAEHQTGKDPVRHQMDVAGEETVNEEPTGSNEEQNYSASTHSNPGEGPSKEAMDENGEEVLEAAEDTVIY